MRVDARNLQRQQAAILRRAASSWTPPAGLLGWWYGDLMDSGKWADRTDAGNHISLVGAPVPDADGLPLDGTSQWGVIPIAALPTSPTALSLSCWVRLDSVSGFRFILSRRVAGQHYWALDVRSSGMLNFELYNGTFHYGRTTAVVVSVDTWAHVLAAYDQTAETWLICVDGSPVTITRSGSYPSVPSPATVSGYVGTYNVGVGLLDGRIDDIQIYDIARTADDAVDIIANSPGSHA